MSGWNVHPSIRAIRAERLAEARTYAGLRSARFARSTGTLVVILDGIAAGLDTDGGRWSTLCDDHGTCIAHDTLALARWHAPVPEEWCEECRDAVGATWQGEEVKS